MFVPALQIKQPIRRGMSGLLVQMLQYWTCLHLAKLGSNANESPVVACDGDFGPGTEAGVKMLQTKLGFAPDGVVTPEQWTKIVEPLRNALTKISPMPATLGEAVVAYADHHFVQRPREAGGENCGIWPLLYTDGQQGVDWPWCAAAATFLVNQAARDMGVPSPVSRTAGCTALAAEAKKKGLLVDGDDKKALAAVKPGAVFLLRAEPGNKAGRTHHHAGIVKNIEIKKDGATITAFEGNTNDDGSREGYEFIVRTRKINNMDFVII